MRLTESTTIMIRTRSIVLHARRDTTVSDGLIRQVKETLAEKYKMAMSHELAGLGMWSCDLIDYPLSSNPLSKKYWDQIAAYAKQMSKVNK